MAFSSTLKKSDVHGSLQVQVYTADFNAVTTGHIKTGLSNIIFAVHNNEVTEGDGKVEINRDSGDTAAEPGGLLLSGFTLSDVATVIVYGN